jgi:uncharacterized integral membrane protein (TIGR00698 family)
LVVTFVGFNIHWKFDSVSPLVASLVIGVVIGNLGIIPKACAPGQKFAAKKVLRFGIVLLGTQLAAKQIVELGGREVIVVLLVVATTFLGTMWLGPRLGVSKSLSLLIATGFSICGASAVAAVDGVVDAAVWWRHTALLCHGTDHWHFVWHLLVGVCGCSDCHVAGYSP